MDNIQAHRQAFPQRINLEMGRFFVASAGEYVSSVVDLKENGGQKVCIIDGGKNHISYYGQNMAIKTPVIEVRRKGRQEAGEEGRDDRYSIFGSLCSYHDVIARDVCTGRLDLGDRLVFKNAGAYAVTEGMSLFLSRDLPAVYMEEHDGKVVCARGNRGIYSLNKGGD